MKKITLVLSVFVLAIVFGWLSLSAALRICVKDVAELYGSDYAQKPVHVRESSVVWGQKQLGFGELCVDAGSEYAWANVPSLCVGSVSVMPEKPGMVGFFLLPLSQDAYAIKAMDFSDLVVFYDIDTGGENLVSLRQAFLDAAANAAKDRLNAFAQGKLSVRFYRVASIKVLNVRVSARSKRNPSRSREFPVNIVPLVNLGSAEAGIAAPEVLARVVQEVVDQVRTEAVRQGVAEPKRASVQNGGLREEDRRDAGFHEKNDSEGFAGTVRSAGRDVKDASKRMWQRVKNIF